MTPIEHLESHKNGAIQVMGERVCPVCRRRQQQQVVESSGEQEAAAAERTWIRLTAIGLVVVAVVVAPEYKAAR